MINNIINSADIYINYQCGLRCNHCFIGDKLNLNLNIDYNKLIQLLEYFKRNNVLDITLLGGEPTLYPRINCLLTFMVENGFKVRIVTNGQSSLKNVLLDLSINILAKIHICYSIDGSSSDVHDGIRGRGTFNKLLRNIQLAKDFKLSTSGIFSISNHNIENALDLLNIVDEFNFKYLNIHYVSGRGFGSDLDIIQVDTWMKLYKDIKLMSKSVKTKIRFEKTFFDKSHQITCSVKERKNLLVMPDLKAYYCPMFLELPNSHSYTWSGNHFEENIHTTSETKICSVSCDTCLAMEILDEDLSKSVSRMDMSIGCVFEKEELN